MSESVLYVTVTFIITMCLSMNHRELFYKAFLHSGFSVSSLQSGLASPGLPVFLKSKIAVEREFSFHGRHKNKIKQFSECSEKWKRYCN